MAAKKTKRKKRTTAKRKNAAPRKSRKVAKKRAAKKVIRKKRPAAVKRNSGKKHSAKKRSTKHKVSTAKRKNSTARKPRKKTAAAKRAAKRGLRKGSKVAFSSGKRPRPFLVENKRRKKSKAKRNGKPRRRNSGDAAARVYQEFHGRPSENDITLVEPALKQREEFGGLGELRELCIETPTGLDVKIPFAGKKVLLCATTDKKNLYFKGGDQRIDLHQLKMDGGSWRKDKVLLGVCYELTYRTHKGFDRFITTDYFHELGEETGTKPVLSYDTLNHRLELIGGQFTIRPEGITN